MPYIAGQPHCEKLQKFVYVKIFKTKKINDLPSYTGMREKIFDIVRTTHSIYKMHQQEKEQQNKTQ